MYLFPFQSQNIFWISSFVFLSIGKGGKNRRRGKNENETEKRELVFKEDGQGESQILLHVSNKKYLVTHQLPLNFFFLIRSRRSLIREICFNRSSFLTTEYAQVTKMLGNGRLEAMCFDGIKRLCHIRGKLRKKVWINQGDIILIGLRDYQDAKADVILKYTADEARNLKTYGEFPETGKFILYHTGSLFFKLKLNWIAMLLLKWNVSNAYCDLAL